LGGSKALQDLRALTVKQNVLVVHYKVRDFGFVGTLMSDEDLLSISSLAHRSGSDTLAPFVRMLVNGISLF
jgi:hypothetical protein